MVTNLYLRATAASEPKPNVKQLTVTMDQWVASTLGGGQDNAGEIYPIDMRTTPGSDATQKISQSINELGVAHNAWFKAWISPPLSGDQSISGTLTVIFDLNEGNGNHNMMLRIYVYVWKKDDTGVRGVLVYPPVSSVEADTTDASLQTFFSAILLSTVNALDGDRIVIEVSVYDNNTKSVAYLHAINFDGAVGSNRESYIQFSQNLVFSEITETIMAKSFPMLYLPKPTKAEELKSTVEGATISKVTKDFPETLIKSGKAKELRSKWT